MKSGIHLSIETFRNTKMRAQLHNLVPNTTRTTAKKTYSKEAGRAIDVRLS